MYGNTKRLSELLEKGLQEYLTSGKYQELLSVMSKFHNYSFNNCVLIATQCPEASYVAGYVSWRDNFHRQVRKGATGIQIKVPMRYKRKGSAEKEEEEYIKYKSAYVFDISMTDPIPDMEPVPIGIGELQGSVKNYRQFLSAVESLSPVLVEYRHFDGTAKGYYNDKEQLIVIQDGMTEKQTIKTLIHEIAHSLLHTQAQLEESKKTKMQKELEAESIACVVCMHFGIDTEDYSFPYIVGWTGTDYKDVLQSSMSVILKTSDKIIKGITESLES